MSRAKEFLLKVGYKGTHMREGVYELWVGVPLKRGGITVEVRGRAACQVRAHHLQHAPNLALHLQARYVADKLLGARYARIISNTLPTSRFTCKHVIQINFRVPGTYTCIISSALGRCWGSVTFWCGSRAGDPYLWLTDPTPFFSDFKGTQVWDFRLGWSRKWIF